MKHFPLLFLLGFTLSTQAQTTLVPKDYRLQQKEDYARYEADALRCMAWLDTLPMTRFHDQRKAVKQFLQAWIQGHPDIHVELREEMTEFMTRNPNLLIYFLIGWARHALQQPADRYDEVLLHAAALRNVLAVYEKGEGVNDDDFLDEVKQQEKHKRLEKWIARELKAGLHQ
ncbi:MAG: hypothetical protein JNJ58_10655 [Chitinophagaceae bacterium]|nr:hypothetical protein [Chitinophagaceae bacterium]